MIPKLFASLAWILIGAAWIGFVLLLTSFASWGDSASSSFYSKARYLREGLFFWIPLLVPILGIFSPYNWFPKKALRFACWPWSPLSFILGAVVGFACLQLI
jgi:hypothetical protein